ncbi:hypothetical protein Dimus_033162 [Dionaea muscipula]
MLAGVKFVPRDQVSRVKEEESDDSRRGKRKSSAKMKKERRKGSGSGYSSSSEDKRLEKIKKGSRKKKWYASVEYSSSSTSDSADEESSDGSQRMGKKKRKEKKRRHKDISKNRSCTDEANIFRCEMGLEWMTKPVYKVDNCPPQSPGESCEDPLIEEVKKGNSSELNPYLKDNGSGYPEDGDQLRSGGGQLLSSSLVGDGGASWRLKALKRAKEQAAREGKRLEEVVEERWGSLGHLAVSVASHTAAPTRAHLHAINSRKFGGYDDRESDMTEQRTSNTKKRADRDDLKNWCSHHSDMRAPKIHDSLSWGRRKSQNTRDADLISSAVASLNKFDDDGSFLQKVTTVNNESKDVTSDELDAKFKAIPSEMDLSMKRFGENKQHLTANQLAARALQLRMKGRHEEADKLLREAENSKSGQEAGEKSSRPRAESSSYAMQDTKIRQKREEDNSDVHLAQIIMKNKTFSISGQADDEYDYDDDPSKRSRKKGARDEKASLISKQNFSKHIMTQQERCQFCFENPSRPKHLVVAIANFSYLMLPPSQPVVPGHCCILPLQHEAATRSVDDNVWEEIRNFKKCLIMMFSKHEKEVVFLETVVGLAQQRRHCLIECIPLPQEIAKQAPLYFKKAIDEAEEEWSQHNAKKLIDTSQKGLRASIPKNFPYFHVEFGLNRGFVHVIDDEKQFRTSLGLNVIRGMVKLSQEDMYRRRRYESAEAQKQAVASFARQWEPFDWTKQLS